MCLSWLVFTFDVSSVNYLNPNLNVSHVCFDLRFNSFSDRFVLSNNYLSIIVALWRGKEKMEFNFENCLKEGMKNLTSMFNFITQWFFQYFASLNKILKICVKILKIFMKSIFHNNKYDNYKKTNLNVLCFVMFMTFKIVIRSTFHELIFVSYYLMNIL